MNTWVGTLLLISALTAHHTAPAQSNVKLGLSAGIASGWWIYNLGTGSGIDRTDFEPKITFEGEAVYKPKRLGIGLGLGYSFLTDNVMEAFQDTRAQRRKYFIADNVVQFWQYYLQGEYDIYSDGKYALSPQFRIGGFSIETTHPQKDNFNNRSLMEFSVLNQIVVGKKLELVIRPYYQVLMISVKEELLPGENHRIYSLGLTTGLRYVL